MNADFHVRDATPTFRQRSAARVLADVEVSGKLLESTRLDRKRAEDAHGDWLPWKASQS